MLTQVPRQILLAAALFASAAVAAAPVPTTGNSSDPVNWRFAPGQSFNGVAGALDGVARLTFSNLGGNFACSGSLLAGGAYVLTAGHCADNFTSMTVEFGWFNGVAQLTRTVAPGAAVLHPEWRGFQISSDSGADLALLRLDAPVTSIAGYRLSSTLDIGKTFLIGGYGTTADGAGSALPNWNDAAYGHVAYNTFDVTSAEFNRMAAQTRPDWPYDPGHYAPGVTYMSDFDNPNGAAANNTLGRLAAQTGNQWSSGNGLGLDEGMIASGDSGGGGFVWNGAEWLLSAVHSWVWPGGGADLCRSFGLADCDISTGNNASYGDLSGSTAMFSHAGWVEAMTAVPEPLSYAMMLAGLCVVAARARHLAGARAARAGA